MKFSYLLAGVSNRAVGLVALLALSHIMSGEVFGTYALMSINALLIHTLFGSWLAMATTWSLATDQIENRYASLARISIISSAVVSFEFLAAALLLAYRVAMGQSIALDQIISTLGLAVVTLCFDVTIASKNAIGDDRGYLRLNVVRNVGASILVVAIALVGGNASLTLVGQTVGVIIALAFAFPARRQLKMLASHLRDSGFSMAYLAEMLKVGLTGALALGLLVLVNSLVRNLTLLEFGRNVAGVFALMSDIFLAPLVLLGSAYSLSKMRKLYQLGHADDEEKNIAYHQFFATLGFLTIPYGVGGYFLAPAIASHIVPIGMQELAVAIAGFSVVQSSALAMNVACITLLLTAGRKRQTLFAVSFTLLFTAIAAVIGGETHRPVALAQSLAIAAPVTTLVSAFVIGWKAIPWRMLSRSMLAASCMALAVKLSFIGPDPLWIGLALLVGIGTYGVAAMILRPFDWRELVPSRNS